MRGRGSRVTPRRPAAVGSFPAPVRRVAAVRARDALSAGLADAPPQPSDARGQGVRGSRGRARGGCNAVRQAARTRSSSAASAAPPVVSAPATRLPGFPGRPASHRRPLVHRDSRRDALHETCTCLSSLPSFASLPPHLRRVPPVSAPPAVFCLAATVPPPRPRPLRSPTRRHPPPASAPRLRGRIATSPRLSLRSSFRRRGSLLRRGSRQRRLHLGCGARAVPPASPPPPPPPRALGAGSRWHCFPLCREVMTATARLYSQTLFPALPCDCTGR